MTEVDVKDIAINENAYFYKVSKKLTKDAIIKMFNECISDKKAKRKYKPIIRRSLQDGPKEVGKYSLDIFEFKMHPTFFKNDTNDWEVKYGFFLILEYEDYVGLIMKNVSGVRSQKKNFENIDYSVLAYFLVTPDSKFEKIVSNSMNTASNALQTKTSESRDLKGTTSTFGASKQILKTLRLDNKGSKSSIALNTSRVNSFNLKTELEKVLFWMIDVFNSIEIAEKALPKSPFIDSFASQIKFQSAIKELEPTFVLLRFGDIKDDIEAGIITRCFKKEGTTEVDVDLINEIEKVESLIKLTKVDDDTYIDSSETNKVRVNENSITFYNSDFSKLYIDFGERNMNLNSYINGGNHFIVNFDKIEYVYSHRKIFKDSRLLGDLDTFLRAFKDYKELESITSEKGSGYSTSSTHFKKDSIFHFIETELAKNADCLICDDMGTEWGDYISLTPDETVFYHAKGGGSSLSASNLEIVFGQAQKNFGSIELREEMINARKAKWLSEYKEGKIKTSIKRIRKSPDPTRPLESIKEVRDKVSANPNQIRKVYIVINSLSKKRLADSLYRLKKNGDFEHKGVTLQILWLVSSLLTSANELGIELYIICKP